MDKIQSNIALALNKEGTVTGLIHRSDIISLSLSEPLENIVRRNFWLSMTTSSGMAVTRMAGAGIKAALVSDENGSPCGVITLRTLFDEFTKTESLSVDNGDKPSIERITIHANIFNQELETL
jgi:CBS domain containing-hemolysin-like protein